MAVFRIQKTENYTVMSNYHLRDRELSCKACGLLSKMLSLPEDWDYTTRGLASICKDGVDSIGTALKELEKRGYLVRRRIRGSNGRLADVEYVIYETPQQVEPNTDSPHTGFPDMEKPDQGNPCLEDPRLGKPSQLSIEKSSTDEVSTDPSIYQTERVEGYWELRQNVSDQLEAEIMGDRYGEARVLEVVELVTETMMTTSPRIRIGSRELPTDLVQARLRLLDSSHLEYVFDCLDKKTGKVKNMKAYLLAALFNAPATIDHYYRAEVNSDFAAVQSGHS